MCTRHKQHGTSLIELIMFIMIVAVALAGILLVMNTVTKSSADPLIHKQALAIAESLLEEIELQPFTYCDPDDLAATTANSTADCTAPVGGEVLGPEAGETRYAAPNYDNVNDYNNFSMAAGAILDISGANTGLAGYRLDPIVIVRRGLALGLPTDDEALWIAVTVTGPDNVPVVVEGIRTRYSPTSVP